LIRAIVLLLLVAFPTDGTKPLRRRFLISIAS
jgi:hypothetical protein